MKMTRSCRRTDLLFDARQIDQSGIGTYISAQLPHLEEVLGAHNRTLTVLADPHNAPPVRAGTQLFFSDPAEAPVYSLAEQRAWDHALRSVQPKAFWTPHYPFPFALLRPSARKVLTFITVHDDNHLLPTDTSGQSRGRRLYARTMLQIGARRSRVIFTPSSAAADALAKYVPSAQFVVTSIPLSPVWFDSADAAQSPVQGKFILYLGNVKRHKNLPVLLKAYDEIQQDIPHTLVIAGSGASVRTLDDRVRTLATALGDRVQMLGRLEFARLRSLMAAADLLVMPSFNEGAGLPPLEAMASGTAVLASAIPSLQETCGDGADYFNPHDPRELAGLMRTYCLDRGAHAQLTARGAAHVSRRQSRIAVGAAGEAICAELDRMNS
ncbi:glycosyltransferase family 4 protein [Mycolicibacterium vaccae]|uniref:glycosyltransferase family 4 protein n=1 Tax=Mycolicibacterium vaccae TaxID=1810 RepID=UPI003CEC8C57